MIYFLFLFLISYLSVNYEKYKDIKNLEILIFFTLFLIIGLRFRTGGDFRPYIDTFDRLSLLPPPDFFKLFDVLNYLSHILGLNLFGVNIFCSFLFICPLYFFLKKFKNIYLSLVLAFPVIVMVYGLGSIRQGIALALFLSIVSLRYQIQKILILLIGLLFHASSIINISIYVLSSYRNKYAMYASLIIFIMMTIFFNHYYLGFIKYYVVQSTYTSSGFIFRNAPTFICAIIYCKFYFSNNLIMSESFNKIFLIISLYSLVVFPLGFFYSTAADRVMAYFLPLQLSLIHI